MKNNIVDWQTITNFVVDAFGAIPVCILAAAIVYGKDYWFQSLKAKDSLLDKRNFLIYNFYWRLEKRCNRKIASFLF